jgi:hypothetical protein
VLVAVCLLVAGKYTYLKGMPTGGTNSAVTSASCHVKYTHGDEVKALDEVVDRPLQWASRFRVRRRKLVIAVSATRKLRSRKRVVCMLKGWLRNKFESRWAGSTYTQSLLTSYHPVDFIREDMYFDTPHNLNHLFLMTPAASDNGVEMLHLHIVPRIELPEPASKDSRYNAEGLRDS